ncbi:MAG: regulatory protein RecX [Acidobacteria bacterium]|nr:regulatory protein RecX [Acidobacteriota bacterium]
MARGRPGAQGPPPGTPRLAALRLLGRRDYSSTELITKLVDRGYAADDVRTTVEALMADGTVDDRRTAFTHVRTAARVKGRGTHRIRRELEARGIGAPIIREALEQLSPDDDLAAIRRLLARRRLPHPIPPDQRRRLFAQLIRRGFASALVARALDVDPPDDTD